MSDSPILCRWDGLAFQPLDRFKRISDERYVVGEVYYVEASQGRSESSHRHYFACINEAWKNLPDEIAQQFPTPEVLRKKALILAGYANITSFVTPTRKAALQLAAYIRKRDDCCIVEVRGQVISVGEARSQSHRAMGKKEFQDSKEKVLEIIAGMIGTSVADLASHSRAA
jgi:hypothetical protein